MFMRCKVVIFTLLFSLVSLPLLADVLIPKSPGINWSTLKRCVGRTITLENGDTIEVPIASDPFRNGTQAIGYEVELTKEVTIKGKKIKKIKVWVYPKGLPARQKYWCHGLTFDESVYNIYGDAVPAVLAAGYDRVECPKPLPKGHIIVYYTPKGDVAHSAVSNGDGTFNSKNGALPHTPKLSKADMDKLYQKTGVTTQCFKPKTKANDGGKKQ